MERRYHVHSFSLEELLLKLARPTRPKTLWLVGIRMVYFPDWASIVRHVAAQFFGVHHEHVLPSYLL